MPRRWIFFAIAAVAGCGDNHASTADAGSDDVTTIDVTTSKGMFTVEVHRSWAPNGADRFLELVDAKFYDDARFFRVIHGFVAQFGINGTPATNAMWSDKTISDDPVVASNTRGMISFAQDSQPDSRTTQLFVNLVDNKFLDKMRFAPFATVASGLDVVDQLDSEYGEAPDQDKITAQGNAYLTASFPNLDYIVTARAE